MKKKALKILARLAVVAAVALALAAGLWLARGRIAGAALRAILPHGEGFENAFVIRKLGWGGVEIADARLGGFPCVPSFKALRVRWTLKGLRMRRIDAVRAEGIGLDVAHRVPGFKMPTLGGAGWPAPGRDILKGWTVGFLSATTETLDFAPLLGTNAPSWLAGVAQARLALTGGFADGDLRCRMDGTLAGLPLTLDGEYSPETAKGRAALEWRVSSADAGFGGRVPLRAVTGTLDFAFAEARGIDCTASGRLCFEPCEWDVPLTFRATPDGAFSCGASLEEVRLSNADPLVGTAMVVAKVLGVALPGELSFSGAVEGSVEVVGGGAGGPRWGARGTLSDVSVLLAGGAVPVSVTGGRVRGAAEGIGGLVSMDPCFVSFEQASIGVIPFGKGRATLLSAGEALVVSEASVGFCGGAVRLYALYLDLAKLAAGFTLYLDNLQLSEALALFPQMAGSTATGRLHGRLPLRYTGKGEVRLGEGFVYTPPGETGNVKIKNPEALTSLLGQAGLPEAVRDNFAKALKDLDYDVLRLDLVNPRGEDGRVVIRLQGKSRSGVVVTPVNLKANVNGPIEKFLNVTIKTVRLGTEMAR